MWPVHLRFRAVLVSLALVALLSLVVSCASPPCANVCQEGESACLAGGKRVLVCARDATSGCWSWASLPCDGEGNQCGVIGGKAQCTKSSTDPCKQACTVGGTRCSGNTVETCMAGSDGACPSWSLSQTCTAEQLCQNGACVNKPAGCQDTCTAGAVRCAGNSVETCEQGQDQCWRWQDATPCPASQICQNGKCESSCQNVCKEGEKRCAGNNLQVCVKHTQGNCTLWSAEQPCPAGQSCQNGACQAGCQNQCKAGEVRCDGGKLQTCTKDATDCLVWGTPQACPAGQSCQAGKCVSACQNKCQQGQKRCVAQGLQACTKDATGCLVWGTAQACPSGQVCQTDKCVTQCNNACTQGQTRCDGASKQQACVKDSQGCWKWGTSQACGTGLTCQGDRCKGSGCQDACKANTSRCYGNGSQPCQVGSNGCTEWGKVTNCAKGQVCDEGKCGVVNLNQRTQQQICARWKRDYPITTQLGFKNDGTQCDPGSIAQGAIDDAIRRLSLYRWLTGLSPTVEDPALSKINQACAILQANNDGPSGGVNAHSPPASWKCYTQTGAKGSGSSNLSWGVSHPADTIDQYISDAGVSSLGHRLWSISPGLGVTGFGMATGSGRYRVASCMYTFARAFGPTVDYVAFPPPGWVPIQAMGSRHRVLDWSFNSSKYGVSSLQQVTLTRQSDNDIQNVTTRRIGSYGQPSGISFRPRFPKAGETYTVKMGSVFSYTVKFFDCK